MAPLLLAVDAGIRFGFAHLDAAGRVLRYGSHNFGAVTRLRAAVPGLLAGVSHLVVEGGGPVADPWLRVAERRGLVVWQTSADRWRPDLVPSRHRRSGADAKQYADGLARQVLAWSGAPRPTALRHDAAEAILVGLWAAIGWGWTAPPPFLTGLKRTAPTPR